MAFQANIKHYTWYMVQPSMLKQHIHHPNMFLTWYLSQTPDIYKYIIRVKHAYTIYKSFYHIFTPCMLSNT